MVKRKIVPFFMIFAAVVFFKCSADSAPPPTQVTQATQIVSDTTRQDTVMSQSSVASYQSETTQHSSVNAQHSQNGITQSSLASSATASSIASSESSSVPFLQSSATTSSSPHSLPPQDTASFQPSSEPSEPEASWINEGELLMLSLVNGARSEAGVPLLQLDSALSLAANAKADDLDSTGVLSHQSETFGGGPTQLLALFGITSRNWGENIANNRSVEGAFNAWMNSEGHRRNILNASFTHMGYANTGRFHAQIFIQRR